MFDSHTAHHSTFHYVGSTYPQVVLGLSTGYSVTVHRLSTAWSCSCVIHRLSTPYSQVIHRLRVIHTLLTGYPQSYPQAGVIHRLPTRFPQSYPQVVLKYYIFACAENLCLTALYNRFLTRALQPSIWSGHYSFVQPPRPPQTCFRIHVL